MVWCEFGLFALIVVLVGVVVFFFWFAWVCFLFLVGGGFFLGVCWCVVGGVCCWVCFFVVWWCGLVGLGV